MIPGLIDNIDDRGPSSTEGGIKNRPGHQKKPPRKPTNAPAAVSLSLFASAPRPPTGDDGVAMGGAARRAGEVARFVAGVWVSFWSFPLATLAGWVRSFDVVRHPCDHLEW